MQLALNEDEIYLIESIQVNRDNFIAAKDQNPGPGYYHKELVSETNEDKGN